VDSLEHARESYARHDWLDAFAALSAADAEQPLGGDDLERLAWSAAHSSHDDVMLTALERAYQAQLDEGAPEKAARHAFWLGFRLTAMGERGRGGAWLGRAERVLAELPRESAVRGYLLVPAAYRHIATGKPDEAVRLMQTAAQIGDDLGDADLAALARCTEGRARVKKGELAAGLACFDEAMLVTSSGTVLPIVAGLVYCSMIANCNRIFALDRAREWTLALGELCASQPQFSTFAGTCEVHRCEVMQLGGQWREAIAQAERVCRRPPTASEPGMPADAHYQLGELHRLRGELADAEAAFRAASELGRDPQPGLSLLRLSQGRADAAASMLRRLLGSVSEPLERARFLPACVEISVALGDLEHATRACEELEQLAARFDMELLHALSQKARGTLQLSQDDAQSALPSLRKAFMAWQKLGAPHECARLRVLVARACRALGDDDGARLELDSARAVFEDLGALPDLAQLDAVQPPDARRTGRATTHGLTERELQVLRLLAAGKTNKQIGRELFVSEKTVDRHVSNIFAKLGVGSRAAATAFAYEHGLIGSAD